MAQNAIKAETLTSIYTAGIGANYLPINAGGFTAPCLLLRIVNASNTNVMISYDGVHDHEIVHADNTLQLFFQLNNLPNGKVSCLPKGTIVYAKGTAGIGLVYLAAYYTKE